MDGSGHIDVATLSDVATLPDNDFKPPSLVVAPSPAMNYSPKHSRKPNSLSLSRNINMKHLSLNISSRSSKKPSLFLPLASSTSASSSSSSSAKSPSPSLCSPSLVTPLVSETPLAPPPPPLQPSLRSRTSSPRLPSLDLAESTSSRHRFPQLLLLSIMDSFSLRTDVHHFLSLLSPFKLAPVSLRQPQLPLQPLLLLKSSPHSQNRSEPWELYEQSNLLAYPNGPANVLNSRIFLYSDPLSSDVKVDINDYDLVINVAKECPDLLQHFDSRHGTRCYMHVPWCHTSSIQNDLPRITSAIAAHDKPGHKVLIHCHCGVLRSACVVVAYFMVKFSLSVNDAYELLKSGTSNYAHPSNRLVAQMGCHIDPCDKICPNMSLIFELMDFGHARENGGT